MNSDARRIYHGRTALSGEQSRHSHGVPSPETSPPSIIVTDLCQNGAKDYNSNITFNGANSRMEHIHSDCVIQNGHQTADPSVSMHAVRWTDQLSNFGDNHEIWKVCRKYF